VTPFHRLVLASRATSLAATVGLALSYDTRASLPIILGIIAVAAAGTYLATMTAVSLSTAAAGEAAIASGLVAVTLPHSLPALPYLVVLPLTAGLAAGIRGASLVIAVQLAALPLLGVSFSGSEALAPQLLLLAPWTLIIVIAGLAGAWAKRAGLSTAVTSDADYDAARRLLVQLRGLSRRLSSGLDPVGIGRELLTEVNRRSDDEVSGVLTRTESGVTVPLAFLGVAAAERIDHDHQLVQRCWTSGQVQSSLVQDRAGGQVHMLVLPLRVGRDITAVIVSLRENKSTSKVDVEDLNDLALRLETALAFDDVRRVVTADERHRLAREIHDGVAQEVASLGYEIDELRSMAPLAPSTDDALAHLRSRVSRVVSELRLSIFDLRSDVAVGAGLGAALSDHLRILGTRSPLTVHLSLDEAPTRLSPAVETELFRISQEAITNARKHSGATNLWVVCRVRPPEAQIEVVDDGRGITDLPNDGSYGLKIMRERAARIGAELKVTARDEAGRGTRVTLAVGGPLDDLETGSSAGMLPEYSR
jgi:signal transduction histidine kinase